MADLWFVLLAAMLAAYVVFDGFDLGAGALHLFVARRDDERRRVLRAIGPVWDGNEVWLIAAGGTLFFAFPALFATALSGFYLPLMLAMWLLIGRACAVEFRNAVESAAWTPLWDAAFAASSALLAFVFGAALGNVVRGVPLDEHGRFFVALWTDFSWHGAIGVLDAYTVTVGALALLALSMHGALWLSLKTTGRVEERSRAALRRLFPAVTFLLGAVTVLTFRVRPELLERLRDAPWRLAPAALAIAALALLRVLAARRSDLGAFLASCACLALLLGAAAATLHPEVLPATTGAERSLTAAGAAASRHSLTLGLWWWIPGVALVSTWFAIVYRVTRGKVE